MSSAGAQHPLSSLATWFVVRIEHVSTALPAGSFHLSHSPANANNSPSLTSKQYGCFAFPIRNHSYTLPATIYGNNEITCGNSYSTLWTVTALGRQAFPRLLFGGGDRLH